MITLSTKLLQFNKESRTFSQEISCLDAFGHYGGIPHQIGITSERTGITKIFDFIHADKDGSGEDTYGWNFRNPETKTKFLLIND